MNYAATGKLQIQVDKKINSTYYIVLQLVTENRNRLNWTLLKENSKKAVYTVLNGFRKAFEVAPVTQPVIDAALSIKWNDFEDAIHYQVALAADCDAIITRNQKDFKQAELPVLSPQEFLDQLNG